jgi:hypothetical protein
LCSVTDQAAHLALHYAEDPRWTARAVTLGERWKGKKRPNVSQSFGEWRDPLIKKLRKQIVAGRTIPEAAGDIGINKTTAYRWIKRYPELFSDNHVVVSVVPAGTSDTWDLQVDGSDNFVANGVVVHNSIAATQPGQESTIQLSGDKNIQPARLAALMSIGVRRLNASNKHTAVLCINQTRMKVGMVFGNPETTPGGKAIPFYASYRVRFTKAGRITENRKTHDGDKWVTVKDVKAQKIRAELMKSKLSVPEKEVWFQWSLEKSAVDEDSFLASAALERGLFPNYQSALNSLTSTKTRSKIRGLLMKGAVK